MNTSVTQNKRAKKVLTPYEQCLEWERQRIKSWRKSAQGSFESGLVSLDKILDDAAKGQGVKMGTDNGRGAIVTRAYADGLLDLSPNRAKQRDVAERRRRLDAARRRIERKAPYLMDVFNLIVKNGNNRKESIWELSKILARRKKQGHKGVKRSVSTSVTGRS